jgi:hypothetical protein
MEYKFGLATNGMNSTPDFMNIRSAVLEKLVRPLIDGSTVSSVERRAGQVREVFFACFALQEHV